MVKIDIISGFLGAGKTTLIKKLLQDAFKGQQVVLIENEFGEIGIDGGFLKDAGIEIKEMNSGCICCSLVGDFGTALKEVVEKYHPDRIVIEPSGVGKLSDVIHAVENLHLEAEGEVKLNSAVTVVDVLKCKMYLKNFGEFFKNQVEAAGTIILSRTDTKKATPEKIEAAIELIRELNPDATIITTPVEDLGGQKILDTIEGMKIDLSHVEEEHEHHHEHGEECTCGCHDHEHHHDHEEHDHEHHHDHDDHDHEHHHDHEEHDHEHHHEHGEECTCGCHDHDHEGHHHHHHADEVFTSWGKETVRKYSRDEIEKILKALSEDESYGMILRAKRPLLDRMELIEISSYTENEKLHIAKEHLLQKQIEKNGLESYAFTISDGALKKIISGYTREAGVRTLERRIGEVCRKAAKEILEQEKKVIRITESNLARYLGKERYHEDKANEKDEVGIVRGLAWTSVGGVTLQVEVNCMPGKGNFKLTGQIGDVMKESAQTAISYIRSIAEAWKIDKNFFQEHDIHIHIPEGAVPKDGPSAGITMATAILSAITGIPVHADTAMTGEITLRGRVLPIGGLKEKLLAAKNAGMRVVLVPEKNRADVQEISAEIKKGLDIQYMETMDDVLKLALCTGESDPV